MCLPRLRDPSVIHLIAIATYRIEGVESKVRRLPPKSGQRRPLARASFPGISRLSTRKLQARYTHATEIVARGRKEGSKEEEGRERERERE